MVCPRCGAEMKDDQRYCMRCGALNYNHPDNQQMKQYITKDELNKANEKYQEQENAESIQIGGQIYMDAPQEKRNSTYVDTRASLGLLTVVTLVLAALGYFIFQFSVVLTLAVAIVYFIYTFYIIVNSCIYMKGGYSGFVPIIPFYNLYAYFDIAVGNGWKFLFLFIPIFNIFYGFYVNYRFGKVFGKNGWFTLFFPYIMLPIIAFSDKAVYDGEGKKFKNYVNGGKRRNTLVPAFVYSAITFVIMIAVIQLPFISEVREQFSLFDINRTISTVKKDIDDGIYECDEGTFYNRDGVYYISFKDATSLLSLPIPVRSSINGKKISGYIKVESLKHKLTYDYATTDGENVFTTIDGISSPSDVVVPEDANICKKS